MAEISRGQVNYNTVAGSIGLAGAVPGVMRLLFGDPMAATMQANGNCGCCANSDNRPVNRYELAQESKLAAALNENSLLKANIYNDQKTLETYAYINGELKEIRDTLCAQAVHNQRTEDSFALVRQDLCAVKSELAGAIALEAERRCCADNSIVNYANATFYPKLVADVTAGTTTTAQTLYNPIPKCGCCNGN